MGSKSNTFENELLLLIFNNTDIANIGDAAGLQNSATAGSLYVSLHTGSSIADTSTQTSDECTYTGYARVGLARTSGATGWDVTNNSVSPGATITFGACTVGSETATHFGVGVASAGAGKLLYWGAITPNIVISAGVTPQLTTATAITED